MCRRRTIRDTEVHATAQQSATARHVAVTDSGRQALRRELVDIETERERRDHQLRQLFERFDRTPAVSPFGDDDMYDENGLPH